MTRRQDAACCTGRIVEPVHDRTGERGTFEPAPTFRSCKVERGHVSFFALSRWPVDPRRAPVDAVVVRVGHAGGKTQHFAHLVAQQQTGVTGWLERPSV